MRTRYGRSLAEHQHRAVSRAVTGGQHTPTLFPFLPALVAILVVAAGIAWLAFVGFARLSGFEVSVWKPVLGSLPPERLFDVTRAAATAVGVLGGVFAVVYAYRRQRIQEAGSRREDGEQLSQRYQDAAGQLGHDKAAVRLAGVYAMSRLADDWVDQRQQCVDVLCAYVRLPVPHEGEAEEQVIRRTILDEIRAHTSIDKAAVLSWSSLRLDLTGARLDDFVAVRCKFRLLILRNAQLSGNVAFLESSVQGQLILDGAQVRGAVSVALHGLQGHVSARRAHIYGGGSLAMATTTTAAEHNDFSPCGFNEVVVDEGGRLRIELSPGARKGAFSLDGVRVLGALEIYGTGVGCDPGAINTRGLATEGAGVVTLQEELFRKPYLFSQGFLGAGGTMTPRLQTVRVGPVRVVDLD
jgi:hypothetical protein